MQKGLELREGLEGRFFAAMARLCPGWPGGRYVCAFSGGGDSTALLGLLAGCVPGERLLAAHLDHGLRESSAREAEAARDRAAGLGIRCVVGRVEAENLARERGKGLEEAARAARYGFLREVLDDWPGDFVVTAHQAEDLAETVIMKLARGAGPGALVGMAAVSGTPSGVGSGPGPWAGGESGRAVRRGEAGGAAGVAAGWLVRPLLGESRAGLEAYLEEKSLGFTVDPSNADGRFGRNLVRREILPVLAKLNPADLAAFGRAANLAAAEEEFWSDHLDRLLERLGFREDRASFGVKTEPLAALSLAERRRVIGRLMGLVKSAKPGGGEGVSLLGIETALGLLDRPGAGGLDLPGGRRVERRGDYIYIGPASRLAGAGK